MDSQHQHQHQRQQQQHNEQWYHDALLAVVGALPGQQQQPRQQQNSSDKAGPLPLPSQSPAPPPQGLLLPQSGMGSVQPAPQHTGAAAAAAAAAAAGALDDDDDAWESIHESTILTVDAAIEMAQVALQSGDVAQQKEALAIVMGADATFALAGRQLQDRAAELAAINAPPSLPHQQQQRQQQQQQHNRQPAATPDSREVHRSSSNNRGTVAGVSQQQPVTLNNPTSTSTTSSSSSPTGGYSYHQAAQLLVSWTPEQRQSALLPAINLAERSQRAGLLGWLLQPQLTEQAVSDKLVQLGRRHVLVMELVAAEARLQAISAAATLLVSSSEGDRVAALMPTFGFIPDAQYESLIDCVLQDDLSVETAHSKLLELEPRVAMVVLGAVGLASGLPWSAQELVYLARQTPRLKFDDIASHLGRTSASCKAYCDKYEELMDHLLAIQDAEQ